MSIIPPPQTSNPNAFLAKKNPCYDGLNGTKTSSGRVIIPFWPFVKSEQNILIFTLKLERCLLKGK